MIGLRIKSLTLTPQRSSAIIRRSRLIEHTRSRSVTLLTAAEKNHASASASAAVTVGKRGYLSVKHPPFGIGTIGTCASLSLDNVHIYTDSRIKMTAQTTPSKRTASVAAATSNAVVDTDMKSNKTINGDAPTNGTSLDNAMILSKVRGHLKEMKIDAIIGMI